MNYGGPLRGQVSLVIMKNELSYCCHCAPITAGPETGSQVLQLATWWDGYNNLSVVNSCKNILGENKFNYVLLAWASLEPSMRQTKFSISFEYLHFSLKLIWMLAVLLSGNLKCNWFKLKFSQHTHAVSSLCPVCNTFVICCVYSRVTPLC